MSRNNSSVWYRLSIAEKLMIISIIILLASFIYTYIMFIPSYFEIYSSFEEWGPDEIQYLIYGLINSVKLIAIEVLVSKNYISIGLMIISVLLMINALYLYKFKDMALSKAMRVIAIVIIIYVLLSLWACVIFPFD